jgi:hypothetical protein
MRRVLRKSLDNPEYYLNRDLSWLQFNGRVLEEAEDDSNPLLERVKFLAITASNLDEFFEVRIASLLQRIEDGYNDAGPDGLSPGRATFTNALRLSFPFAIRCSGRAFAMKYWRRTWRIMLRSGCCGAAAPMKSSGRKDAVSHGSRHSSF